MLVKYISSSGKSSHEIYCVSQSGHIHNKSHLLKENKYYLVYAMKIISHSIWYYIYDELGRNYPDALPNELFEMVDPSMSKYWNFTFYCNPKTLENHSLWVYPEWINDRFYHERLIEGNEEDVKIFKRYQSLMNLEFPNPFVKLRAESINEYSLLCMDCIHSWEIETDDAMVICPKCHKMMHNPTYKAVPDFSSVSII